MISEAEYAELAARELDRLVEAFDSQDADNLEAELESGILTLEFADGAKYVINSHRAARQIWMAAERSAWHFDWNGTSWVSDRSEEELWEVIVTAVRAKLPSFGDLRSPSA